MPVNEKILVRSFQYLFSLKSIIYAILSSAMLHENHAVFWGKNIDFRGGGGGGGKKNYRTKKKKQHQN
jgi:hypothetical protein